MKKLFIVLLAIGFVFGISLSASAGSADALSTSEAGAAINQSSVDKSKNYNRNFPIAGNTPIPMTNGFFTAPTPDSSFRSVTELIRFNNQFSRGSLEELASGGDVDLHYQMVTDKNNLARGNLDGNGDEFLTIVIVPSVTFKSAAMVDGEADDADTNSFQVIGKVGLKAMDDGCNTLYITAEGAHRGVEASGWGIGLYTVGGTMTDTGKSAGLVGGGTGYAQNKTGTEDKPWIQGYAGMN